MNLQILNSEAGRHLLGIKNPAPIVAYTDNSIHQLIGKDKYVATFWTFPRVKKEIFTPLTKMEIAENYIEDKYDAFLHFSGLQEKRNKYPQVYLTTDNFTGQAGEGVIFRASSGTFAGNRGAADGDTTLLFALQIQATTVSFQIARTFFPFDTASIPDGATISSAKITLRRDDSVNTFGNANTTSIELTTNNQASPTTLANADYDQVTFVSKGSTLFSATSNGASFDVVLTDLTLINKTGSTQIAAITGRDLNNSAPTGDNTLAYQSNADANPPTLQVVYTSTAIKTYDGLAIASVKTVDGLAIASVKTINGLA